MGAGISKEQERKKKYYRLRVIERELMEAGVGCYYHRMCVCGVDEKGHHPFGFTVRFGESLRASNGECFGVPIVEVNGEKYAFLDCQTGLERIKALYGDAEHRQQLPITELSLMICKIEGAVKFGIDKGKEGDVFLHDAAGNRVHTEPGFGMESGQLFAYNEMQDDKPMLRIGQGIGKKDYTELLPGMSVRWRDGRIIVARA